MDKYDFMKAQAHTKRLKSQTVYTQTHKDGLAAIGAPQRDHVAAAVLTVVFRGYRKKNDSAYTILACALDLLESYEYERQPTWARINIMSRQRERKLKRPVPKVR